MMNLAVVLLLTFLLGLTACGEDLSVVEEFPCDIVENLSSDDVRPDVLVIGDSISIGYWPYVSAALPAYDVVHNRCNARFAKYGSKLIDSWLEQRPVWSAITFNHGIHDVTQRTSDAEYEFFLRSTAMKVQAATARPFFVLTTRVPPGNPNRSDTRVQELNAIATRVMGDLGIPVIDLYTVSWTLEPVKRGNVHFKKAGHQALAAEIVNELIGGGL